MGGSKDSAEVAKFMRLFAKLRDWCDDDPDGLLELAEQDEGVRDLCRELAWAATFLKMNERRHRQLFAAPVDPKFVSTWRNYEERFESVAGTFMFPELFPELDVSNAPQTPKADLQWENADDDADEQADGIEEAIEFAQFNVDQEERWIDQPDFIDNVQNGIAAWERLKQDTGFDLRGVFRRRELIPFVLIPRHVGPKRGRAGELSMLNNLQQAHDAFVFGAPYAALALMRSIMEAVLRDDYGAQGKDLSERINDPRTRLPTGANAAALHRLRRRANAVLHLDAERDEGLPKIEPVQLEKEIVSLLLVLRRLIEGVPQGRPR